MAKAKTMTFEEVDRHIEAADLSVFEAGGEHHVTRAAARGLELPANICPAYKTVKPILVLVSNTPLIPEKWRKAVKVFIMVMDTLCG